MSKSLSEKIIAWAATRPEFEGFTAERSLELRGQRRGVVYRADVVLVKRSRLSVVFKSGPMSGTAVAITIGRGSVPMTERDVAGVQHMAADVFQAAYKGTEKLPIQLWVHITTQPYDESARRLAGQMRLAWFGRLHEDGDVEQIL